MSRLYLRVPTKKDKRKVLAFKKEFLESGQKVAGFAGLDKMEFDEWLTKIQSERNKETCEEGRVPATQFLAIREKDEKLIGMVQVRHELNDYLLKFGGHIGDCIRPTERQKGYATEQKRICLEFCKTLGLNKVLVTAKSENEFSIRSITKCGGVLENQLFDEENNQLYNRYWINL
jgi:predicted acetyltransferase